MNKINQISNSTDWRTIVKTLKTAVDTVRQNAGDMSGFELRVYQNEIKEARQRFFQPAYSSVVGEYHGALGKWQSAKEKVAIQKSKEIDRWDQSKLSGAMAATAQRLQGIAQAGDNVFTGQSSANRVEKLLSEAMASKDDHFRRAVFETLADSSGFFQSMPQEARLKVNRIAKEAERQLEKLRITPEMLEAKKEEDQALNEAIEARENLLTVAEVIDPTIVVQGEYGKALDVFAVGPFAKEYRKLNIDRETGEVSILDESDWRLTGVFHVENEDSGE